MKALLRDRDDARAARRIADVGFDLDPRCDHCVALVFELSQFSGHGDPERPPGNDAYRHHDETEKDNNHPRPQAHAPGPPAAAARLYAARHARSLALRARGLAAISTSDGRTALRVIVS